MKKLAGMVLLAGVVFSTEAFATMADPIVVPNPGRIPIGDIGALEGGAAIARASDGSATWYNPAGLIRAIRPSVSGNASLYEFINTSVGSDGDTTMNIVPTYIGSVGFFGGENGSRNFAWGFSVTAPTAWKSVSDNRLTSGTAGTDLQYYKDNAIAERKTLVPAFGVAYAASKDLSFGATLQALYTTENFQFSSYSRDDQTQTVGSSAIASDFSTLQSRLVLGASWRPTDSMDLGLVVKSPGVTLSGKNNFRYNLTETTMAGLVSDQTSSEYAELQDGEYEEMLPLEMGAGCALKGDNYQIEVDANYRFPIAEYNFSDDVLTSNELTIAADGTMTATSTDYEFGEFEEKGVLNGSIGGYYKLGDAYKIHGGLFTDRSSLKNSDVYQKMDLYGVTTGVSFEDKNSSVSVGLSYTFSNNAKTSAWDEEVGDYVDTDVKVNIFGFVLGGRYYF